MPRPHTAIAALKCYGLRRFLLDATLLACTLSVAEACASTPAATLATAETWAERVCRLVVAVPEASASALPPGVVVNVTVTPSAATAVVSAAPSNSPGAPATAVSVLTLPLVQAAPAKDAGP